MHEAKSRALEGRRIISKRHSRSVMETRELLEGRKEINILSYEWSLLHNSGSFSHKKTVSRPGVRNPQGGRPPVDCTSPATSKICQNTNKIETMKITVNGSKSNFFFSTTAKQIK